ncbi:SDR family NAD(P)-dependent oxidoreductase [Halopenitus persicus]|uniref:SDR family NAD(P)-dependent oxidoreductase n=1 Tax=Halopenitus persicus TaxID=1048396 RepID=UPI000BBA5D4F|nr:SDR family NAD(P)-dependent oxidoreductase [Halopenitus persicus]
MTKVAVIAGLGPGFSEELAWKLAKEGYTIGLFSRSSDYLSRFESELTDSGYDALAVPTDVTDSAEVSEGFNRLRKEIGHVETVAYTASTETTSAGRELEPDRFERLWQLYAYGGLLCFREALDDLRENRGTMLFFGSAPEAGDFAYKSGKAAARGLARSLNEQYSSEGIHISHIVIDGALLNPDVYDEGTDVDEKRYISPEAAADTCYHLINQPDTSRTFELDLHTSK